MSRFVKISFIARFMKGYKGISESDLQISVLEKNIFKEITLNQVFII